MNATYASKCHTRTSKTQFIPQLSRKIGTPAYVIAAYYISRSTVAETVKFAETKLATVDSDVRDLNYARCSSFNPSEGNECVFDQLRREMYAIQAHWSEVIKIARSWKNTI